jgi:hypothetical protein
MKLSTSRLSSADIISFRLASSIRVTLTPTPAWAVMPLKSTIARIAERIKMLFIEYHLIKIRCLRSQKTNDGNQIEWVFHSRNPQPATRNPKPATRNPQPVTRNP